MTVTVPLSFELNKPNKNGRTYSIADFSTAAIKEAIAKSRLIVYPDMKFMPAPIVAGVPDMTSALGFVTAVDFAGDKMSVTFEPLTAPSPAALILAFPEKFKLLPVGTGTLSKDGSTVKNYKLSYFELILEE